MLKTKKIGISLPKKHFEAIEKIRKKLGLDRSAVIDLAIQHWLKAQKEAKLVQEYIEGYKRKPESIDELKAMEQSSARAFEDEEWK